MRNALILSLAGLTFCGLNPALAQTAETTSSAPAMGELPIQLAWAHDTEPVQTQVQTPAQTQPPRDVLPQKPSYSAYVPYGIPDEDRPKPDHEGSTYIPLDSWVYPQLDRLYSMGYLNTMFLALRPYTRRSVLHMLQDSQDEILQGRNEQAQSMLAKLLTELAAEQPDGKVPRDTVYGVHQVYDRGMYISQTTLRDSYHLGQTIVNDYGRPYQPGFNNLLGGAVLAEKGRFSLYARAEYQHAPGAAGYTSTLANTLSGLDQVGPATGYNAVQATIPQGPIAAQNPFRLVEGSVSYHLLGHEFSGGKNDAWLGPAHGGGMAWSNNAENIYSFRINRVEPMHIPFVSRFLGPLRYDFFYGSLKGHTDPNHPYIHAETFSFRPTSNFEFGFERTIIFGGAGHSPVTIAKFFRSFFDVNDTSSSEKYSRNDPGARFSAFNFSYRLPFVRRYATFYADSIAHDDVTPPSAPRRAAFRTGIYLSQLPRFSKLDFRVEAVSTDPPTSRSMGGLFNYFETIQVQGYTNKGYILGDWIGREAKGGQAWITYHQSPTEWYELEYLNKKTPKDFVPLGTTQNSVKFTVVKRFFKDYELNYWVQYERWKAPIYLVGQRSDTTLAVQFSYFPPLHSLSR